MATDNTITIPGKIGKRYRSIHGAEAAGAFNPHNPYGSWSGNALNLKAYNPDDLVRAKGIPIYKQMTREPFVKAALQQKKTALLSVPWDVHAASNDPRHIAQARFIKQCFKNLKGGFQRDLYEMCDALDCGWSLLEQVWDVVPSGEFAGKVWITALKSKDPEYFEFAFDEFMNIKPEGIIMTHAADGRVDVPLEVDRFFVFSYLKRYENAYGSSDLRAAYRAYWIKDTAWKLRAVYMERFSGNNLKGKYPRNKDAETNKNDLLAIFRSWQSETGIAIPEDLEVEVMDVAVSSESEYSRSIADCNKEIAIAILGEALTIDEGRKTGARNMGEIHAEVVALFVLFLDMTLTADINEQLIKPLIDANFADVDEYPEFFFFPRDYDPVAFGAFVKSMQEAGMEVSKTWVELRTRMPKPSSEEDTLKPVAVNQGQGSGVKGQGDQGQGAEGQGQGAGGKGQGKQEQNPPAKMAEGQGQGAGVKGQGEPGKLQEPTTKDGYSRELSKFEKFAEIPKVDNRLKMLTDKAIAISQPAYDQIFKNILAKVEKTNVLASRDYSAAAKIAVNPAPLRDVLFRTLLTANMMGRADVVTETQNQGYNFGKIKKFAEAGTDWSLMEGPFTPEEASNFFAGKVPMTREEYEALTKQLIDQAFYVAGLDKAAIEGDLNRLLADALYNGMSLDTFKFKLQELQVKYTKPVYERAGVGQASADDTVLDYHAETVFRTNIMSSYNAGRKEIFNDPDVKEFFPAYEYTAIMDGRTTEICSELDGMVRLAGDPAWDKLWPPNHFNCRSTVVSINKYDFTQDMITEVPDVKPMEGFGG